MQNISFQSGVQQRPSPAPTPGQMQMTRSPENMTKPRENMVQSAEKIENIQVLNRNTLDQDQLSGKARQTQLLEKIRFLEEQLSRQIQKTTFLKMQNQQLMRIVVTSGEAQVQRNKKFLRQVESRINRVFQVDKDKTTSKKALQSYSYELSHFPKNSLDGSQSTHIQCPNFTAKFSLKTSSEFCNFQNKEAKQKQISRREDLLIVKEKLTESPKQKGLDSYRLKRSEQAQVSVDKQNIYRAANQHRKNTSRKQIVGSQNNVRVGWKNISSECSKRQEKADRMNIFDKIEGKIRMRC